MKQEQYFIIFLLLLYYKIYILQPLLQNTDRFKQELEKNYFSFKKVSEQIKKDYPKIINETFTENNWNEEGKKITINMNNYQKLIKDLTKKVEIAKNEKIDNEDINDMVKKVESELNNAKNNIDPLIGKIKEKVKYYACDFQLAANQEIQNEAQGQELVMDLMNNKDILDKRRQNLEDIHQTSAQIKDLTDKMALDINNQGAILNEVENKVTEAEDNAVKAKKEIIQADKLSKSNKKRVIFYVVLILIALIGIGLILYYALKK